MAKGSKIAMMAKEPKILKKLLRCGAACDKNVQTPPKVIPEYTIADHPQFISRLFICSTGIRTPNKRLIRVRNSP
jgi:hypothetical protein